MPWLLAFHIASMLFWCATLLYMPALIAGISTRQVAIEMRDGGLLSRFVFTRIATPLAVLTIVLGTAVFVVDGITDVWLILKLTLVSALAVCHVLNGWLLLRLEDPWKAPPRHVRQACLALGLVSAGLIAAVVWLVLAKPF